MLIKEATLAILLVAVSSVTADADPSPKEVIAKIDSLQAQINALKASIGGYQAETRRMRAKLNVVQAKQRALPVAAVPAGPPYRPQPISNYNDKSFVLGGITITPGGFLAAESVFRSRTTQSDMNSSWAAIPFRNSPLANTNEFRFSARQTRVAALVEGDVTPAIRGAGYFELDFLGAAHNATPNQTNGYQPRIRNLYTTLDFNDYGVHFLAGQSWSLVTMNSKGITPRNEVTPPVIDSTYMPGFAYARQPGVRIVKDFDDHKLWFALSAEGAQTTFQGCTAGSSALVAGTAPVGIPGVANVTCQAANTGGGFDTTNNFSLNHAPDIIGKAAYELIVGNRDIHTEAFGIYRNFYDRVAYGSAANLTGTTSANQNSTGYGVGGGIIIPVLPRLLDVQASGLIGRGIGRYGVTGLSDATFSQNGAVKPLQESLVLVGATVHATPRLDLYVFAGLDKQEASYFQTAPGTYFGVGAPNANDSGCSIEYGTCSGNTKGFHSIAAGFWDRIYEGRFGYIRAGVEYNFTQRELYASTNFGNPAPKSNESTVMTSVRYYPF